MAEAWRVCWADYTRIDRHKSPRYLPRMTTATEMRDLYIAAEVAVLNGRDFAWADGRRLSRVDLEEIRKGRQEWEARVSAEAAAASGRSGTRHLLADFTGPV